MHSMEMDRDHPGYLKPCPTGFKEARPRSFRIEGSHATYQRTNATKRGALALVLDCPDKKTLGSMLLHVVAKQLIVAANVEMAVVDHWMGPTGPRQILGQVELTLENEVAGRRFDESHDVIVEAEIEMAIGAGDGSRAMA